MGDDQDHVITIKVVQNGALALSVTLSTANSLVYTRRKAFDNCLFDKKMGLIHFAQRTYVTRTISYN